MLVTVLGLAGLVLLWLLWQVLGAPLLAAATAAAAEATGLAGWFRRIRFRERQAVRPGAYTAAVCGILAGISTTGFGVATLVAPPEPWDRGTGITIVAVGALLLVVAVLLTIRWWRVSTYHLP